MGDEKYMQHGFMSYARNFLFLLLYILNRPLE